MAGVIGAGGLGDLAIRYGYYRYESELMLVTIVILVVIVQAIQFAGNHVSKKINRLY
jgi:D-methionine transport system permease protein